MSEHIIAVSVSSLLPAQFSGWGTKQGGKWKTWKRRFFVLKDRKLWYFENESATTAKGWIELPPDTVVTDESERPKRFAFSISSRGVKGVRTFHLTVDSEKDLEAFYAGLNIVLKTIKQAGEPQGTVGEIEFRPGAPATDGFAAMRRFAELEPFLQDGTIGRIYDVLGTTLPKKAELMDFAVTVSADADKIGLRVAGRQAEMVQAVVDTFWALDSPQSEIVRMNDVGVKVDPEVIGLWLDLSGRGGMDGGWFFHTNAPLEVVALVADEGSVVEKVYTAIDATGVGSIHAVARDLGSTPPNQSEFVFTLHGESY